MGVRFRAEAAGYIARDPLLQGAGQHGDARGDLWTNGELLLARATFTGETTSGWQTASFAQPVPVKANTTYVASYLAPAGHYAILSSGFFASTGTASPPLYALMDGVAGANGVYKYTTTPAFPSTAYQSTNYWVDIVYTNDLSADTHAAYGYFDLAGCGGVGAATRLAGHGDVQRGVGSFDGHEQPFDSSTGVSRRCRRR